jgi:hypothetical protein
MWWALLALLAPTEVIDDPFEASIIYMTRLDESTDKPNVVYADSNSCSVLQVSDRSFASSKKRGAKDASSFLEFKLTSVYKRACGDPLKLIDVFQGRYFGALAADVDVLSISANCAITICKDEYSVSVRLTNGLASVNDEVIIKFGAPHSTSFLVRFPFEAYVEHRATVVR